MELPQKLLKGDVIFDSKEYKHVIEVIKKYEKLIHIPKIIILKINCDGFSI